ncbi:MAG: hypothetical protein CL763_04350 [Chloroflexi bacterium]|nr:hypothetical protein [Chloroflexota bacterium]|tara:strand:- start:34870 stop:35238 length:369 start_codon:yes stop_codon:yes gene_type:complete
MRKAAFEELVRQAVENIPEDFRLIMHNVDVHVRRMPTQRQLKKIPLAPGQQLLGLYEGIPLTQRDSYGTVLPDIVTVFQIPIEKICTTYEEIEKMIQHTVIHEVAHFFGITDVELEAWGIAV